MDSIPNTDTSMAIANRLTVRNTVDIEVMIVEGRDLVDSHRLSFKPAYFVEVGVDHDKQKTSVCHKEKSSTKWDEKFVFAVNLSSCLHVRIYCHHDRVRADHVIGEATIDLLKAARNEHIDIELHDPAKATTTTATEKKLRGRLTLHLKVSISATFSNDAVSDVDLQSMQSLEGFGSGKYPHPGSDSSRLSTFCMLASAIAELNPKSKVVVGAVSFAIKILVNQINRDDKIKGLIDVMNDLYYFFLDADPMHKIISFKKTVDRLLSQTTECSYFIAEYLKTASIAQRAMLHMVSNADAMIAQFEGAFGELKIDLILGTSLQTAVVSFRILDKVENILNLMYIDQLPYSRSAGWDLRRTCLRGTRQDIIDDLVRWACDTTESEESHFFLLFGPPGCGKSAMAHTISQIFHQQGRLGAAVFLDSRCVDREVNSQTLSSTIAFQLASYDTRIKERMAARLSSGDHLASADVERQFPELIVASLKDLTIVGPIVIVIDGLPDPAEQRRLLTTIINSSTRLPSEVRLLLTSRHDPMIPAMVAKTQEISFQDRREPTLDTDKATLSQYIYACLDDHIFSKGSTTFGGYNRQELHGQLTQQAMGMNFWVFSIRHILSECSDREKRIFLDIIQACEPPRSKEEAMDHIYHAFLAILPYPPAIAHAIFDTLIKSSQPLVWPNSGLLGVFIVEKSLDSRGTPLFGLHPSFEDFLTDIRRVGIYNNKYFVDRQQTGAAAPLRAVGALCLEEMNSSLKHNLCELQLMVSNEEILDKLDRIRQFIPEYLQYACCNWVSHVEAIIDIKDASAVVTALQTFLFTHLLHWFEVMSLSGFLDIVVSSLERLAVWIKERAPKEYKLREITSDGLFFIRRFSPIIYRAAMLTYVSALPLMPPDTLLFEHYRKECLAGRSNLTSYSHFTRWEVEVPAKDWAIESKQFEPSSVAYHGYLIAKSHVQVGMSFYDPRGEQVAAHRQIEAQPITSMAFSPDGQHIVTAATNGFISIWEVKTGTRIHLILTKFTAPFVSYSSDGTRIVAIGDPVNEAPFNSKYAPYRSKNRSFRSENTPFRSEYKVVIWDAITASCVQEFDSIISGAIALSGGRLALSRESEGGGTIVVLRVRAKSEERVPVTANGSGEAVFGTLKNPTPLKELPGIKFSGLIWSPDGRSLAASLDGGVICLWSLGHGSTPRLTLHLPTKEERPPKNMVTLRCVAFSSDSLYIASIHTFDTEVEKNNGLISVWDTDVGGLRFQKEFKASLQGPSISFLPDSYDIFVHWGPDGTPPPIHLVSCTNPLIPNESNALTIEYSNLTSRSAPNGHDYVHQVDSDGWISNTTGERQMWVPYANYDVASVHLPYSGREGSLRKVLEVKHPETKEVVLRFEINFEDAPESCKVKGVARDHNGKLVEDVGTLQ